MTFARAANSSLVQRRDMGSVIGSICFGSIVSTTLPFSLPLNLSKSASVLMTAKIGSPVTTPPVPGVQANWKPISGWYCGSNR